MEGSMRFSPFTTTAVCSLLIALGGGFARPAWAAEIRVLNANALTIALRELAAEHTKQTGNQITFISGSPGQIQQKVDAGEKFDLLIMPTPALASLDTAGKLAAGTRRGLVRVGIGIAIREGTPKPDITTPDALRKTLLAQQKITYSDSSTGGLSGINAQKVLQNLGIADEMKGKAVPSTDGQRLIANGEADLGLYNVSEIPRAKGVVLLGPVPAAVQAYITYDAGVPASHASPSAAIEFLKFIASPAAAPSWLAAGLELAAP
jgi:molybdate transport system substrate-binding protein